MRCKITYEDKDLLVIHKPAGLATQSANVGQADAFSELKGYLSKKDGKGSYLGVIHRLDQPVEGLLVFAKNERTAAALSKQLQKGALNKTYYAVTLGQPLKDEGVLTDFLLKDGNVSKVVTGREKEFPGAKEAILSYRLLESAETGAGDAGGGRDARYAGGGGNGERISLLEVQIETGRFHQIRAQLSHAGLPILGDQKYGNPASARIGRELRVTNVALCARSLEITHPATKKRMCWEIIPEAAIFSRFSSVAMP